jgi:hypothetical protein
MHCFHWVGVPDEKQNCVFYGTMGGWLNYLFLGPVASVPGEIGSPSRMRVGFGGTFYGWKFEIGFVG